MSLSPHPTPAKQPRMDPQLVDHHGQVAMDPTFIKAWLDKGKTFECRKPITYYGSEPILAFSRKDQTKLQKKQG